MGDKLKKFFQLFGLVTLICFSFFYTEKIGYVVKEIDVLMKEINEKSETLKIDAIDAKIIDNTITPGIIGRKVNINKSYDNMKRINQYNNNMIIYDKIYPNISIKNNFDKYVISGNSNKKEVSIILVINEDSDINYIKQLAKEKNIKFNIFVNSNWFENNNLLLSTLISEGHNIGNLGENGKYNTSTYIWMDTILKKVIKQENNYCYLERDNQESLEICSLNKNYTIKPSIVVSNNATNTILKNITSGSIISIPVNQQTLNELKVVINSIKNKGYKIVTLNELLSEN